MKIHDIYIDSISKTIRFLVGTSAKANFDIIDESEPGDLWFHARDYPSCHVIAEVPPGVNTSDIINIGSELCVFNTSKIKDKESVFINYDNMSNVKKTKIIGTVEINTRTIKTYRILLH